MLLTATIWGGGGSTF